ncbi:hypothetical protein, partial [Myroides odoratus]|uniref:hypothetical protein n=1 Tax=Myroides odoratus TaxID=256 RepID=UPI00333FFD16
MNIATLHTYLADPTQVQRSDIQELKQLLEQYPYVQALRSLYLKALYSNESTSYNQELKKTAAYTLDRDILFSFIVSDDFTVYTPLSIEMQDETEEQIETVAKEKDKDPEQNISTLLQTISKVAYEIVQESPALTDELEKEIEEETVQSESSTVIESPIKEEEEKAISTVESLEDKLEIGKPLAFEAEEKYSFQEWLKLSKQQPIVRELDTKKEKIQTEKEEKEEIITEDEKKFQKSLEKKQAMIDKFIET